MPDKPYIVLDKSFLIGVRTPMLNALLETYRFVATETLLGEGLQAFLPAQNKTPKQLEMNVRSLLKFSGSGGRLNRVMEIGPLISREVRTRHPCWPIEDYVQSSVQFNPDYFGTERRLRDEDVAVVERWATFVSHSVDAATDLYVKQAWLAVLLKWDDDLARIGAGDSSSSELKRTILLKLPKFRARIGTDIEFVRDHYRRWARPFQYPRHDQLTERWNLFRLVQVQLLFQLNLLEKSAVGPLKMTRRVITHDWLDYQYCVLAAQFGAIATGERSQMERFLTLRPDGMILFYDQNSRTILEQKRTPLSHP
jgi:hypothetical protein